MMKRRTSFLLAVVWFTTLLDPLRTTSAQQPTSDENVIALLKDAQLAAQSAFPRARIVARVENSFERRKAKVEAVWDGVNYFVDAECEEVQLGDGGKEVVATFRQSAIEHASGWEFYQPANGGLLQRVSDKSMSCWDILRLRPGECWFCLKLGTPLSWIDVLDRLQKVDRNKTVEIVERSSGEIEIVGKHSSGATTSVVFSMNHAGNVLRCSSTGNAAGPSFLGEYEWEPVDKDRWRLKSYKFWETDDESALGKGDPGIRIEILEFDPNPQIAASRFDISSLNLTPGTKVEEYGANRRRYRLGGDLKAENGISEKQFGTLASELSETGFASEKP